MHATIAAALLVCVHAKAGVEIFIADRNNDAVLRYDGVTGAFIDAFVPPGVGGLDRPVHVTFGTDGDLFVTNFGPGDILRFDGQTGAPIGTFFHDTFWLEEPVQTIFRDGQCFVLGNDTQNLVVLDGQTGTLLQEFGRPTMRYAHGMAFGQDGLLYITTENNTQGLAQKWDVEAETLLTAFAPPNPLDLATGIAFMPGGDILICDWWDKQVLRYDGQTLALVGEFIGPASLASNPNSIAFGPDGLLYVSSSGGVERFDPQTGARIDLFIPAGSGGLSGARGFVFRGSAGCNAADVSEPFGVLDLADIQFFVAAFLAQDAAADLAEPAGVWDLADLQAFVAAFNGGCP